MACIKKPYSKPSMKTYAEGTPEFERLRAAAVKTGDWPAGKQAEQTDASEPAGKQRTDTSSY